MSNPTSHMPFKWAPELAVHSLARIGILLLCFTAWATPAQARIYACPGLQGSTVYQDRPCPLPKVSATDQDSATEFRFRRLVPAGIDESWFSVPAMTDGRAFCDRRSCECGSVYRRHDNGLTQAVADALYLDGSWHRYEKSVLAYDEATPGSAEHFMARDDALEAACDIMISQEILREFLEPTLKQSRDLARRAEDRGYDKPDICLDDSDLFSSSEREEACRHYDAFTLYWQMQRDTRSLSVSRENYGGGLEFSNTDLE